MNFELTAICESCLRSVDLREDEPSALVGWQVVDVREGATWDDVTARDLSFRCPDCAR